jgi:hypothetical protein
MNHKEDQGGGDKENAANYLHRIDDAYILDVTTGFV